MQARTIAGAIRIAPLPRPAAAPPPLLGQLDIFSKSTISPTAISVILSCSSIIYAHPVVSVVVSGV